MTFNRHTIVLAIMLTAGILTGTRFMEPSSRATAGETLGADDMKIAHIAYTAGIIDIRYAHLALAVSDDKNVRAFAKTMLRDHTAVNEKALALLEELGASPKENPTSSKLLEDARIMRSELASLDGPAFDRRYAENELAYHQFVNTTVEEQFIPNVENDRFRDLLREALSVFRAHQRHAERMNDAVRE